MASIFTKIVKGEIPCYKIAEDEEHLAFLDINPLAKGHTLVIPKQEVDYIYDMPADRLAALHVFAQRVAIALRKSINCKRVGVLVIGTEVPHAHIHLIPFQQEHQMAITSPKMTLPSSEMEEIAKSIRAKINSKTTLVFGASANPDRYSHTAMLLLQDYGHDVIAVGNKEGNVNGIEIQRDHPALVGIHTITVYMNAARQSEHEDYLLSLMPSRIIFNPGAENPSLSEKAISKGIEVVDACTLVMLRTGQY